MNTVNKILNVDKILNSVKHKNTDKHTTTLKFKKDLISLLSGSDFSGDILEVGCDVGNTTFILGRVARMLKKKVYAFDFNEKRLEEARKLCQGLECEFIQKDVYKEPWGLSNIGFVFLDCSHEDEFLKQDLEKAFGLISGSKNGVVVTHDYGLLTRKKGSIKRVIQNSPHYEIVSYLGEKEGWNPLGSGKVIDWEGAQIKLK